MDFVVRAVDVGFGNTKYVISASGSEIRCASFPSVAYPSMREPSAQPGYERRKTVAIPINGLFYEVGPEVELAADTFRATQMHDRYTETPEYMALLRGALALMKQPSIDLLVVGLPVAALTTKKTALEKAVTGTHDIGNGKTVVVRKALAIAQPQGALVDFAVQHGKGATIEREQSLILDPGSRTFDWLVAQGMRLVQAKSHSVNRGVFDILQAIAAEIGHDIGTPYNDIEAIDLALRTGKNPVIYQKPYDISRAMPMAHSIAQQAVASMMRWIDASYSFQNIILVGGGAYLFKKAVKEAFPKHKILEVKDPLHANVRGFQIAGMNHAPKLLGAPVVAVQGRCVMNDTVSPKLETIRMLFELDREDDPRLYDDLIRFKKGTKRINRLRLLAHEAVLGQFSQAANGAGGPAVPVPPAAGVAVSGVSAAAFEMPAAADVFAAPLEN